MGTNKSFHKNIYLAKELESFTASVGYGLFFAYVSWVVLRVICSINKQEIFKSIATGIAFLPMALMLAWFSSIFLPSVVLRFANIQNGVYFNQSYRISEKRILKEKIGYCYVIIFDRENIEVTDLGGCIPRDDFKRLGAGDVVLVSGRRSIFGATVYGYKY